jgi:alanyl aminopeptidase
MFEQWLNPDTFRKGILDYITTHEWGNAAAGDLWRSLSEAAGHDIGTSVSTFLDQPGVPLVSVEFLANGRVQLRQERLMNYGVHAPAAGRWEIPVVLRYPDGDTIRTQKVLLTQATETFTLKTTGVPAWIHPNVGEHGYYRWKAPLEMLIFLARHSQTLLSVRERVGLIDHLAALVDTGHLPGDVALQALRSFAEDPQPEVITALADALDKIWSDVVAESEELDEPFARYVRLTLGPALRRFGLRKVEGEEEAVSFLRPALIDWLGDHGHDEAVLAYADSLARAYVQAPSSIDPDLADVVLRLSAMRGDRALFDRYRGMFETTAIPTERARYLSVLGCFRDPQIIEQALQYVLDGPLRPHELRMIPGRIADSSPQYRDRVLAWVKVNYDTLTSRIPSEFAAYLPWYADGCSVERLDAARRFFAEPSHRPPGTEKELEKVAEDVMRRVGLREREGRSVARYLRGSM